MTDFFYIDEIANLIHSEKKPGLMYKKGIVCKGYFSAAKESNMRDCVTTVRFSKVFGKEGESDTVRDVQAMFVKFHSEEDDWDLLSHNIDMYEGIRSPEKITELIKAFRLDRKSTVDEHKSIWELVAKEPCFVPFALNYFSDKGTRKSFCTSCYFGLNEYTPILSKDVEKVKFRWEPIQGEKCISDREAEFLAGFDGNIAIRDIKEALARREMPEFILIKEHNNGGVSTETAVGRLEIKEIYSTKEIIKFLPASCPPNLKLAENSFDFFTAFAFAEGARWRGETRI